mgnify:CR=1 FL=1
MLNIKTMFSGTFIRNVILAATGTASAQIITTLFSPIITRLYVPEAYGIMGTFNSIVFIIAPVVALTYPIALVLPKNDTEANGLARISLYITIVITLAISVIIVFFSETLSRIFNIEEIEPFLLLLPLAIFLSGFMQIIEQWLIRTKQFHISAKSTLLHSMIIQGGKVGIGLIQPTAGVLVFLSAITNGVKALLMYTLSIKSERKLNFYLNKNTNLFSLAKKYKDFPIYRAPETLLNTISTNLPTLMLTTFFGPASAGFYNLGKSVLGIPTQLIGKSVADVFYQRVSEAANNNEMLTPLIKKATFLLAIVGIFPFGIVIFFGPVLFSFVFGDEWEMSGHYARWIALWSFFVLLNRPSVQTLPVLSAQNLLLIYTIISLVIRILALIIGYKLSQDQLIPIILFGISGALLNFIIIFITIMLSRRFDKKNITLKEK